MWLLFRFNDSYEAVRSVPDISKTWPHLLAETTCDQDVAHSVSFDRLLQRLLDATHADTIRYHVTDSPMTSSGDDERQDDVTREVQSAAWLEEYWRHAWALFVTLDLLLIVARVTVTYVNATEIYVGGRTTQQQTLTYHQPAISAANHCIANGQAAGSAVCSRLKVKAVGRLPRSSTWSLVVDAVSSKSLVVIYLGLLVALLFLAACVTTSSAAVDVIVDVIYGVYTQRVRAHRSMSDAVIREQARLTTSTLMQSAQQFDLVALHVFDQYFRLGNHHLYTTSSVSLLTLSSLIFSRVYLQLIYCSLEVLNTRPADLRRHYRQPAMTFFRPTLASQS